MDTTNNQNSTPVAPQVPPVSGTTPQQPTDLDAPSTTPTASTPPPPTPFVNNVAASDHGDHNTKRGFGMMIGLLLVLIVVFLGLMFLFVIKQPSEPEAPEQQVPIVEQPSPTVPQVSPTPELTEENVNEIEIGSPEADLSPIEQDLEQL
jgi:hypothetical protein